MANAAAVSMATRQQVMLERLKTGNVSHLETFLKDAADAIRKQLSKGELTAYSKARLEAQLTATRETLADIYGKAAKGIDDDLREYADYAGGAEARAMEALLKETVELAVPSPAQIYSAAYARPLGSGPTAKMLEPFVQGWVSGSVDKVENALRLGYFQGKTNQQLTQELIGTARNKYRDGIIDATRRNGEMVVRTSMQHMAASARDAFVQANSDIITQVEWVSTLDSRTTQQCFPAETPVTALGAVKKVFRAKYSGEIVTVTTASGKKIKGTPNHPVLTAHGFLPLGEINPRDHVVYSVLLNGGEVLSGKDVGVPSTIGELFDLVSKQAGSHVHRKGATTVDFYGDGVGMDGEVDVISPDCHLRSHLEAGFGKQVGNELLGRIESAGLLNGGSLPADLIVSGRPSIKPAQIAAGASQRTVQPGLASRDCAEDFRRPDAGLEQADGTLGIGPDALIPNAAREGRHNANTLEQGCDGCGGDAVSPSELGSGSAGLVLEDHVVSVERELWSGHVYTVECGLGIYIAGGLLVRNCQALDGQLFPLDSGPRPPLHIGCRSSVVPVLANKYLRDTLSQGRTRASKGENGGAQVSANLTYFEWLKTQPAAFQDEAIGKTRAILLRDGGLTSERFAELSLGKNFEPLNLAEMRRLEPVAFERAGL